jgi:acid phosphatase family membrane protein YuiD
MVWNTLPRALLIALAVQVTCQLVKFTSFSFRLKRLSWRHLATFGGMPSAHSAFVTALATCIGVFEGFQSDLFALAAVFGGIVIFDAYKLRGNVQKQAIVVNRMQARSLPDSEQNPINEMVGHTVSEIVAGIVLAIVVAGPLALLLSPRQ